MIYFDNSATTAIYPEALDTYLKTSQRIIGNPSSLHKLGSQAKRLVEQSRAQIADLIGVTAKEIYFTSGGTEGDNWVVKGTALEKQKFGNHLILSNIEHPAVFASVQQLEKLGFQVDFLPVDTRGFVQVEKLGALIRKETILVSVMAVNNEVGMIQPIKEISKVLEEYPGIHFHVDAVQALGKVATKEYLTKRVDFAVFSGHKFHGPRGVGFIYWKEGKKLQPLLTGGGQEEGRRSTTENTPAIVSMAKALRLTLTENVAKNEQMNLVRKYLLKALESYEKVTVFSQESIDFSPQILTFGLQGVRGEVLVHAFEEKEIFISTTSACSSRKNTATSTLSAMGVKPQVAQTAVRVSLDEKSTFVQAEQFMIVFHQLYKKFSKIN